MRRLNLPVTPKNHILWHMFQRRPCSGLHWGYVFWLQGSTSRMQMAALWKSSDTRRMQLLSHRVQQQQLDRLVQRVTRDTYEVSRGVQHPSTVPHASCDVKKRQVTSHLQDGTCRLSASATQRMQRATRRLQNLFAITLISCVGLGFKFY